MFPGSAKFQTRSASPQFSNFSPPDDYPQSGGLSPVQLQQQQLHQQQHQQQQQQQQQHQQQQHQLQMQMQQNQQKHLQQHHIQLHQEPHSQQQLAGIHGSSGLNSANSHHQHTSMSMRHPKNNMSSKTRSQSGHHLVNNSNTMSCSSGNGMIGHHHRNDLMFSDDLDSIEFCMPPPSAPSNGLQHGVNGDMLLMHGQSNGGICEAFTEKRRRGHSRRSNHKIDVEQQVKWSRKNIAATMERFEPTTHSSSSASSLEYGFAAGVVSPLNTPSHHPQQSFNMGGGSGGGGGASGPYNIYSYAYYEPGAVKCHTNIPHGDEAPAPPVASGPSKSPPPRNSIRALLAKGFRSKSRNGQSTSSSPSQDERHTYTTRYGTTENLYEEVNDQKIRKVLSDNRITQSTKLNVKEELRRVQHNHFRVLDELNLSLEALIMPPTPPDISPNHEDEEEPTTSAAAASAATNNTLTATSQRPKKGGLLGGASSSSSASSQQPTLSHASLENLSTTLNSMELKDHGQHSCINPDFDEGDLDSGFSGSGSSSGASYNESLRYYKTGNNLHIQTTTLPHNLRSCRSSTASGTSTSKSSMASSDEHNVAMMSGMIGGCGVAAATVGNAMLASPFDYARRCSDTQRASARSLSASSATGAKPKKNFWTIKP